jgi:hypothetical protein
MRRLILLTVFSLGPYQLPASAVEVAADNSAQSTTAGSLGDTPATVEAPAFSGKASEILTRMTDFIAAAPAFTMIGHGGNEELQEDGQLLEFGARLTLAIQRPSQANLRIDTRNGANATLILDGEAISIYSVKDNMYVYDTTRQPGDINTSLDSLAAQFGVPRQLGFFLSKDLTASLSRVKSGYYVGESIIDGVMCDHLALRNEKLDVQVWIEKGNEPVPRRMVITHKELQGQPRVWVQFTEWNFSPELSERIFTHSPPQDAERVGFLADMPGKESE